MLNRVIDEQRPLVFERRCLVTVKTSKQLSLCLQTFLKTNQMSYSEFARRSGVSQRTIRRVLVSQHTPKSQSIRRILAVLVREQYQVIGVHSQRVYFVGASHAACTQWVNDQVTAISHRHTSVKIMLEEPMQIIKHGPWR